MSKNSSLKLALCLSGQPRSYNKSYNYIKRNLLDHYNVDTFVHSWRSNFGPQQMKIREEIGAYYEPVYAHYDNDLEPSINSDMTVINASHPANFCTSMLYSIYRADSYRIWHECNENKKYDFVIRCRFDLALNKHIDFTTLQRGVVYVSKDIDGPSLMNDQFAIADSDTMNIYSSTFLNIRHHYNTGTILCGHKMLQAQLDKFNIHVVKIDMNHPFEDGKFNRGKHSLIRDDMHQWVDTKIWGY